MCDDAYEEIAKSGVCRAYKCSVSKFIRMCKKMPKPKEFGLIYLDYCTTLNGGIMKYDSSPYYDLQQLFTQELISRNGCVLAITLARPRAYDSNEPQFCELRSRLTILCVKYNFNITFHDQNNSYDNWITEFYVLGSRGALKKYHKLTEEAAKEKRNFFPKNGRKSSIMVDSEPESEFEVSLGRYGNREEQNASSSSKGNAPSNNGSCISETKSNEQEGDDSSSDIIDLTKDLTP
eukprot:CAMPEP_0184494668 /NCGR_PEP_ID=MMETSP0113_2-20130426/29310_1 /TAXON_ID=91329 /ORGANISM="Norrisiella sphaerica, Strain BC52" /LENGTH=234 /DNA_ID=CAMNT_0026880521 /DNA_START=469 /DNA_END=1173 /DNA_ORIENTATION=-